MRAVAREQPLTAPERAAAFLRALATGHLIRARCVARALVRLFLERATDIVLTNAYEGGHPDHDAAAFAVHAAVELLRREGRDIAIVEMPFYRADGDGWAVQRFAPAPAAVETVLALGDRDRAMKRQMLAAHSTQAGMLALFDVE